MDKSKIKESKEYALVHTYFSDFVDDEKVYVALHLLGSRLETVDTDIHQNKENSEVAKLADLLVNEFSRIACVEFESIDKLKDALCVHLSSSLYRYRYGIQLGNPLIDDIRNQYPDLFEITKKASEIITDVIGLPISDNEIAYLTLHFGASITSTPNEQEMRILIVCPNGISTGNMLRGEVSSLVPNAKVIKVVAADQYATLKDTYTVIISTVFLEKSDKNIVVNPILSDSDRIQILKKCLVIENSNYVSSEEIVNLIRPYIKDKDIQKVDEEIKRYIRNATSVQFNPLMENNRGLIYFLTRSHIQIIEEVYEWQDALQLASNMLLQEESIEQRYVDEIISQTQRIGPYMF